MHWFFICIGFFPLKISKTSPKPCFFLPWLIIEFFYYDFLKISFYEVRTKSQMVTTINIDYTNVIKSIEITSNSKC